MGYAVLTAPCICCRRIFVSNPMRVPSTRAITGEREPICRNCFEKINIKRVNQGLTPFEMHQDAYGACNEEELGEA